MGSKRAGWMTNSLASLSRFASRVRGRAPADGARAGTAAPEFRGRIALSVRDSIPWWPPRGRPPRGAPNIVIIVLDDVGYGQIGAFGGPIDTPSIDRLATRGLRYVDFHTTALCSPTRAALLTGRNHHAVGMGTITEAANGFPGYYGVIPKSAALLPEILRAEGYSTLAVGKWHLTPSSDTSAAGPFDRWPLGAGFEHYYGFLGAETNQWVPSLVRDNHPIDPPRTPEQGYHLTADLTDQAIALVRDQQQIDPDRPFFLYLGYGAAHAPHHVPRPWIERYRGRFDQGWDAVREETLARQKRLGVVASSTELSPRPDFIPAWEALSPEQKRLYARMQEVFAGFLSHTDHHIGRLMSYLEEIDRWDETLVILLSDNGASAEGRANGSINENRFFNFLPETVEDGLAVLDLLGSPETYNHYPMGWALAGDAPLKRYKRETFQGGITDPLIVSWPARIKETGGVRRQYHHVIDLMPTLLEAVGIPAPEVVNGVPQQPIDGVSMLYSLDAADAPTRRRVQYYEMLGRRAIWADGWKAATDHENDSGNDFAGDVWQLYHVEEDFSEARDLAAEHPDKVRALQALWLAEAEKYQVLPLDDRLASRIVSGKPAAAPPRSRYTLFPGTTPIDEWAAPRTIGRSHRITAYVDIPAGGAKGVLLAQGSKFGGFSFFVQGSKLVYVHNYVGIAEYTVLSTADVPAGRSALSVEVEMTGPADVMQGKGPPARIRLLIDDREVGEGRLPVTVPVAYSLAGEGLAAGRDVGVEVSRRYEAPFAFTGVLLKVVLDLAQGTAEAPPSGQMERELGVE
jgi:arylsulfatase A-like enzyme